MRLAHPDRPPRSPDAGRAGHPIPSSRQASVHSLRGRLTLALLFTGLVSAAVVGLVARTIVLGRFDRLLLESSLQAFQSDVVAYVGAHGTWSVAASHEPFGEFVRLRQGPAAGQPPFRFLLLDPGTGRVLFGPGAYQRGDPVPEELRAQARPIVINGTVAALAVPLRQPNYNALDDGYLAAMQHAMLYGVGTAALLALGLGFFFGERLSRNVRALTEAIGAMGKGELRQRVDVKSRDEVGLMAAVFNRMSVDLDESHSRIRAQATLLKELSIRDDLTGLHNRRHFDEQAAHSYARAQRYGQALTVMICDIDHFKRVNDSFSHAVGDAVLTQLGQLLRATTRESDIVARYGGEEFVVVFPETPVARAAALCERIRRRIADHDWDAIRPGLSVTLSMGLDGDLTRGTVDAMLAAADARMYTAKTTGRNRMVAGVPLAESAQSA